MLLLHVDSVVLTTMLIQHFHIVYSRRGALPDADAASKELCEAQ